MKYGRTMPSATELAVSVATMGGNNCLSGLADLCVRRTPKRETVHIYLLNE